MIALGVCILPLANSGFQIIIKWPSKLGIQRDDLFNRIDILAPMGNIEEPVFTNAIPKGQGAL